MPDARQEAADQELILAHYRRPRNRRVIEGAAQVASLKNPFCGDELTVYVDSDGEAVRGRPVAEARALLARYAAMLEPGGEAAEAELGELRALGGVRRLPARVGCARMAERALVRALDGSGNGIDAPEP